MTACRALWFEALVGKIVAFFTFWDSAAIMRHAAAHPDKSMAVASNTILLQVSPA